MASTAKYNRKRKSCEAYRAAGRREANKARKAAKQAKRLARFKDRFDNYDESLSENANRKAGNCCSFGTFKQRKAREFNRYAIANGGPTLTGLHEMKVAFKKDEAAKQ